MKTFKTILLLSAVLLSLQSKSQTLQHTLAQCPLTLQNGTITYYLPLQNGAFFQLPPARKPRYVNMLTSPFVPPLLKSVQATQQEVLSELLAQTTKTQLTKEEKELFLRKLAWCVMLQASVAKQMDSSLMQFTRSIASNSSDECATVARTVIQLIEDYYLKYPSR